MKSTEASGGELHDDPLVSLELHASTVGLLASLLGALEVMSEDSAPALRTDQRSYLAQAMDTAAGLDFAFGELANALVIPIRQTGARSQVPRFMDQGRSYRYAIGCRESSSICQG